MVGTGLEWQGAVGPCTVVVVASPCRAQYRGATKSTQRRYFKVGDWGKGNWEIAEVAVDEALVTWKIQVSGCYTHSYPLGATAAVGNARIEGFKHGRAPFSSLLCCPRLWSESIVVRYVVWWGLGVSGVGVRKHCSEIRGLVGSWCVWIWSQRAL